MPITVANTAAKKPTGSDTRVPYSTPAKTLRPSSSVPSNAANEGACIDSLLSEYGSSCGMKPTASATTSSSAMKAPAARPLGCRASLATKLRVAFMGGAHARIEQRVQQVGEDVDDHHRNGGKQEDALQHWVVPVGDRGDEQVADAGPGEHRLHQDGTGQRQAEVVPD